MKIARRLFATSILPVLLAAQQSERPGQPGRGAEPLFLTMTNGPTNYLVVVNPRTRQVDYVPTGGAGGATGNAGGVAADGQLAAAVNFGSSTVTVFARRGHAMEPVGTVKTASQPVSVAFAHNHLLVLGLTTAESFAVFGTNIAKESDGMVPLARADKSAAQILPYSGGAIYVEKSGSVATLSLATNGAPGLSGPTRPVSLPANANDTPFGMVARGANVYLSIAHSDAQVLIANGQVLSTAGGPTPFRDGSGGFTHAPCWNALYGQFLYSADSPGKQLLRYLVSDANVFYDKPAAARFSGPPTDLDVRGNLMGVIDGGDGLNTNISLLDIDSEGELTLRFAVRLQSPINGAAFIQ